MIGVKDLQVMRGFGHRLRELREEKQLSQAQLAHRAQIVPSQVGRIERGQINASICTVVNLAAALEVPVPVLMTFDGGV